MIKHIGKVFFALSVLLNIFLAGSFLINKANAPVGKVGVLTEQIPVALFMQNEKEIFTLPKGLVVKDSSPNFIASAGLFEPNRLVIEITSDRKLVDFDADTSANSFGELYSADAFYDYETKKYKVNSP
jgi:hypothetical protein